MRVMDRARRSRARFFWAVMLDGAGGVCSGVGDWFGAYAEDFALVGFDYFEAEAVGVYYFAGAGDVAGDAI